MYNRMSYAYNNYYIVIVASASLNCKIDLLALNLFSLPLIQSINMYNADT